MNPGTFNAYNILFVFYLLLLDTRIPVVKVVVSVIVVLVLIVLVLVSTVFVVSYFKKNQKTTSLSAGKKYIN